MATARPEPRDARTEVLAAAMSLFASRGFDGTTIQAIADALGVTKAAVLHHFPSKEELREAVLVSMAEHWQKLLPDLLLEATASEDRFESVFDALQGYFAREPDRARIILREAFDRPDEARALLRTMVQPFLGAVAAHVESGRERGEHHRDLDAECYVGLMLLLVLATASVADVGAAALEGGDAHARIERELRRIARTSLFRQ